MTENGKNGGEIFSIFTGQSLEHNTTGYLEYFKPAVLNRLESLGLPGLMLDITQQHIEDLNLRFLLHSSGAVNDTYLQSRLSVDNKDNPNDPNSKTWQRYADIDVFEMGERSALLKEAIFGRPVPDNPVLKKISQEVSIDWIFGELCFMAAGNAVKMQRLFGRYINDFNGQYSESKAHLAITVPDKKGLRPSRTRFDDMQRGFGLMVLRDSLVHRQMAKNMEQADDFVERVKKTAGWNSSDWARAMSPLELKRRISALQTGPEHNPIGVFVMETYDPNLADYETTLED